MLFAMLGSGEPNKLFLAKADGSFYESTPASLANTPINTLGSFSYVQGNFSGRGQVEILRIGLNGSGNRLLIRQSAEAPDLLVEVKTPANHRTFVKYRSLGDAAAPYQPVLGQDGMPSVSSPATQAADARILARPPAQVVYAMEAETGRGTDTLRTHYFYAGFRVHRLGRGVLGFQHSARQAPGPDASGTPVVTLSEYSQEFPFIGQEVGQLSAVGTTATLPYGGTRVATTSKVYCDKTAGDVSNGACPKLDEGGYVKKVARPYLYSITDSARDLASGSVVSEQVTRNSINNLLGNIERIEVTTTGPGAGGTSQTFTKVTTNTYDPANTVGDTWILGRLARATVASTVPDNLPTTRAGAAPVIPPAPPAPVLSAETLSAIMSIIQTLLLDD
jgi:hypothetical protein